MAKPQKDFVTIKIRLTKITRKAYGVSTKDAKGRSLETFIPRSHAGETDCLAVGDRGTLKIARWLAIEKGIIDDEDEDEDEDAAAGKY